MNERATKEYWNERVLKGGSPQDLVYSSTNFYEFDKNTRDILSKYKDKKVLDVGCGFGRLSDIFSNYTGIDFSEEMIKLARAKYPDKRFEVAENIEGEFDVIFEVMCLSSLEMTPEQFNEKWKAPVVMCLEPYKFTIFYENRS